MPYSTLSHPTLLNITAIPAGVANETLVGVSVTELARLVYIYHS